MRLSWRSCRGRPAICESLQSALRMCCEEREQWDASPLVKMCKAMQIPDSCLTTIIIIMIIILIVIIPIIPGFVEPLVRR